MTEPFRDTCFIVKYSWSRFCNYFVSLYPRSIML